MVCGLLLKNKTAMNVMTEQQERDIKARSALHELGLEIADRFATSLEKRPTHQLVLQKILDPIVRHILNSVFPWIVGVAILFLVLLFCTVVTCVIVLRTPSHIGHSSLLVSSH